MGGEEKGPETRDLEPGTRHNGRGKRHQEHRTRDEGGV